MNLTKNHEYEEQRWTLGRTNQNEFFPFFKWNSLSIEKMFVIRRIHHESYIWYLIKYMDLYYWIDHHSIPQSKMKLVMIKYSNNFCEEIEPSLTELSLALLQNKEMPTTITLKDIIKELNQLNIDKNKEIKNLQIEINDLKLDKVRYEGNQSFVNKDLFLKKKRLFDQVEYTSLPTKSKTETSYK